MYLPFVYYLKPEDLIIQLNYLIITYLLNYFSLIIQYFAEQNYFKFCSKYCNLLFMYHIEFFYLYLYFYFLTLLDV